MPEHTPTVGMERKLAALFSTDVAGYSRLMGDDEEATIRTLTASRDIISSLIQHYRGRVIDSPGDNLLAEFASVVDAVRSAVEIQHALTEKNAELPEQRRMLFRIGINLGDVIVEGERLYGDGVNIAARLESLAIPGGICISGTVYDQIENKLPLNYEYQGEQTVKNIAKPVRVYRIAAEVPSPSVEQASSLPAARMAAPPDRRAGIARRKWTMVAGTGLLLIVGAIVVVRYLSSPIPNPQPLTPSTQPSLSTQDSALRTAVAPAALPLPDKPSLIVLPFVNMSKDPDQDYFSDGLTETLTGDLSKISSLFVIARNSAFTYKGKAVKVQDVGREMGVRYVLEGSVQKADQQVRITAQLIEAATGYHLWSEQYDRPLKDIFALQDEIVQKIVTTLKLQLALQEQGYLVRKRTKNLEAYDYFLRGLEAFNRATQETTAQARQLFEQAVALDPQYAEGYARLSRTLSTEWVWQWSQDSQSLERSFVLTQKAISLEDSLATAHQILGQIYLFRKQHDQAVIEGERAIVSDPNDAHDYRWLAQTMNFVGRPAKAIQLAEKAMRADPRNQDWYLVHVGWAYFLTRRYEEALTALRKVIALYPNHLGAYSLLACTYSELGDEKKAQAMAQEVLRISPNFSLEGLKMPYKDPAVLERHIAALRKAGLK
ncbi:MAG: adenylate/guanylate cyclase domain-containing protein [Deltaproteobacteria bacterium]|nr:adenylate/guanylate cyclase domain-containing protein [Deltaproteobacteria bacterium]